MKLVWSPEKASKAYIDTVKACEIYRESSVAELISAMAAGWDAKMIVETWSKGGVMTTSIGLAVANHITGGRHICIVPDKDSKTEYLQAIKNSGMSSSPPPEVIIGESEEAMNGLIGIDFLVVDCRRNDFGRILGIAKLGHRGAVLICKNVSSRIAFDFQWRSFLDGKSRIVRSVFLPVGKGLDIAHVGATVSGGGNGGGGGKKIERRWIRHFDRETGEEFVIRK